MLCPKCSYLLEQKKITTSSGHSLSIEHCSTCGGTWFDPFETMGVAFYDIVRIAKDTVNPKKPIISSSQQSCPRCHIPMEIMQSDAVPVGVSFYRCEKCRGIWATQRHSETSLPTDDTHTGNPWSVAFVPTIAIFFLALSTMMTIQQVSKQRETRINASAQIQSLSIKITEDGSFLVIFSTTRPMTSTITIMGDNGYALTQDISTTYQKIHVSAITGIPKGVPYRYEIILTDTEGKTQSIQGLYP